VTVGGVEGRKQRVVSDYQRTTERCTELGLKYYEALCKGGEMCSGPAFELQEMEDHYACIMSAYDTSSQRFTQRVF